MGDNVKNFKVALKLAKNQSDRHGCYIVWDYRVDFFEKKGR